MRGRRANNVDVERGSIAPKSFASRVTRITVPGNVLDIEISTHKRRGVVWKKDGKGTRRNVLSLGHK